MLQWQLRREGTSLTVFLTGEIDHHTAGMVRPVIDGEILAAAPARVVLDLSAVGFMDSSGIGLILGRQRLLAGLGGQLTVRGVSGQTAKLVRLAGAKISDETGGILSEIDQHG